MEPITIICLIVYIILVVLNLVKGFIEQDVDDFQTAAAWFCAIIWLIISQTK